MDIYKLLGINKLEAVLNRVSRKPIKENISLCCRDRLHGSGCDLCLKCPTGAINLQSEPFINEEACVNCGLCINLCPTGVFEPQLGDDYYLALIKSTVAENKAATLVFSCQKAAEKTNLLAASIKLSCLARLNETLLLGAAIFNVKVIWLFTANCQECSLAPALNVLREVAAKSEELVNGYGLNLHIVFSSKWPDLNQNLRQSEEVQKEISAYSRRELFSNLGREMLVAGINYTQNKWQELKENMSGTQTPEFSYKVPRKRELLLAVISKLEKQKQNSKVPFNPFFYSYEIDPDKCNFCLNCVKFCPTKALSLVQEQSGGYLKLVWPYCVGCNLCSHVCLPQAITYKESKLSLRQEKQKVLIQFTENKCDECKQPFFAAKEQKLCFFCELRRQKLNDESWR